MGYRKLLRITEVPVDMILSFQVHRPSAYGLELYLKKYALLDEYNGEARTYVVVDEIGKEIMAYFSLKVTGMVLKDTEIESFPMVELADFAVNDSYREKHPHLRYIGQNVFLNYIIPTVKAASDIVGIWGICIYALNSESLIKYYEGKLGFAKLEDKDSKYLHTYVKPSYDEGCIFMYQKI